GIGTTSPQTKLHVNGSAIINGTLIGLSNATDLTGAVTLAQLQAVNTSAGTETDPYWTGNWTDVAFINKANAFGAFNQSFDTNVLFVDSSTDRVGIGTTAPARALSVYKTGTNYIQVVNDVTGITTADGLNFGVNSAGLSYIWNYENSDMVFGSNNAEVMRFNSGNVGIGTTSPSTKLDVQNGGVNIYLG
ncbi:MAG: hypothetical protein KKB62_00520, partial [Nanoarchaeota archaeon]|nr:hypothetical protein [Nanoarchaeota archaeon]